MKIKYLLIVIGSLVSLSVKSQTTNIPPGYAVVVGAYSVNQQGLANKFKKHVNNLGYKAESGLSSRGTLIFVYTDHTQNFKEALTKMRDLRGQTDFQDAWVHVSTAHSGEVTHKKAENEPEEVTKAAQSNKAEPMEIVKVEPVATNDIEEVSPVLKEEVEQPDVTVQPEEELVVEKDDRFNVLFNLVNAVNNEPIQGEVQIIDSERSKLLETAESGKFTPIDDPKNRTGELIILADIFGFRKLQKELNYYKPFEYAADIGLDSTENGAVLNFNLVRYHIGDIVTMYNVFFFKDAAVMRPESKYEVLSLLEMLNENKDLKIKIHGHVNGNNAGPIISVEGNNFFSLSDNNPKGFGSAKELSKQRAEVIRDFLIDNGISPDRMEIKAWGGKRMLYDKNSTQAKYNVRVEIEILEE
ncbi:MAG TPA: OmpA family protein [Fulvivirga sp.]|nr:OmpA family protein [Fulvivirga sp.]